jgi:hypothetical protein
MPSAYVTVRTFTAAAADGTTAPVAGSFVSIGRVSRFVEFSFVPGGSFPSAPTSAELLFWTLDGTTIRLLKRQTILAANIGLVESFVVEANTGAAYVTLGSFSGGSSPTMTLTVSARPVP